MNNMIQFSTLFNFRSLKATVLMMVLTCIMGIASVQAQNDLWIQKANLGAGSGSGLGREGAVSFSMGSQFYIALGKNASTYFNDLWAYDTISETWTQKADYPAAGVTGAFSFVFGDNMAFVGMGSGSAGLTDVYYTYSESSGWSANSFVFPFGARAFASAFAVGTKAYLIGGVSDNGLESGMYRYSSGSWTGVAATGTVPTARMKAIAFTIGDSVYYGTGNTAASTQVSDLYLMDTQDPNKEWFEVTAAAPFEVREGAIAISANGKGYIGFGSNTTKGINVLADFWEFDPATAAFTEITAPFPGLAARNLAVGNNVGNRIYMGTGYGSFYHDDFFEYDPCAEPQFIVQPVGGTVCEGVDYTFTVEVSNPVPSTTYQWYVNGGAISGETNNTLNLLAITDADDGEYFCEVSNDCGTAFSDHAVLEVTMNPVDLPTNVLANPDVLCPGNTFDVTLSADDNGGSSDVLKWYTDGCGVTLVGEGTPVVVTAPAVTTDYYVRWENQCDVAECDTVTVTVKTLPEDPTSINRSLDVICNDYDDELYLFADGGSGDSLTWYLGDICSNAKATFLGVGDTLDLFAEGLIPTQTSLYSVRWETFCGNDMFTSNCLTIEITVDGDFSITTQPTNVSVCNTGTEEAEFIVEVAIGESISEIFYQWLKDDALVIAGETTEVLTISDVEVSDSGYYYCMIYNNCDTLYSDSAYLSVNSWPTIITQPTLLDTICEGDSLTITIEGAGTPVLQYQWYFNGVLTANVDTFLTIDPATYSHTGDYYCEITNGCGAISSDVVSLEVDTIPVFTLQPLDQSVCLNGLAEFEVDAEGTLPLSYQWYKIDNADVSSIIAGESNKIMQIVNVQETDTAFRYFCFVSNECYDGVSSDTVSLAMYAQIQAMDSITSDTNYVCPDYSSYIRLTVHGGQGNELHWFTGDCDDVEVYVSNDTIYDIQVPPITTTYYARWESDCGISLCDSVTINVKLDPEDPTSINRSADTICNDYNDELYLYAEGGSGDSLIWYLGDICNNPNAVLLGVGDTLDLFAEGLIPAQTSTYSVRWETYCEDGASASNCLTIDLFVDGDFSIITQPNNVTVCNSGSEEAVFTVDVAVGESLSEIFYQWYKDDAVEIIGATTNELTIIDISLADTGYYYCEVLNTCDTLYSDSAYLGVNAFPVILTQPYLLDTICEGDSVTFTMEAEGTAVLQYQWYFNSVPTTSVDTFLTINPVDYTHTGDYYCEVSNVCGTISSEVVSMEVDTIPVITLQPLDQRVCLNGLAEFLLEAQGTVPLSYQWYKIDNADVASVVTGETNPLMQIINVQETDTAFRYFCFVSNECSDGVSSDTARLEMHAQILAIDSITSDLNNMCHDYPGLIRLTVYGGQGDSIRWFKNSCEGEELHITSDTIYDIQVPEESTTYFARWENACGVSLCDSVKINVVQEPVMITELEFEDNNICYNTYDSLRISAVGGQGDSIYWYEGFSCIGEPFAVTADTFVYIHDMPTNSVPYAAQWVNICGESNCTVGNLYINDFTIITSQTMQVDACEGTMADMEVIAEGMDQLYYQWFFNGSPVVGMTESELTVGPVTIADTGQYYCQVYSDCDTTLSDSIPLVMYELPYYNLQPVDIWACEGGYDTLRISVGGAEPIALRWYVNGVSFGSYTLEDTTYVVGPAINTRTYYAEITNLCGSLNSDTVTFTVFDTLVINEQPKDLSLCLLDTARFSMDIDASEYVQYEWYKEETSGDVLVGTNEELVINSIGYDDEGNYYCILSDTCGELMSDKAMLNMNRPPNVLIDPFGLTVCEGQDAELKVSASGDSLVFSWYYNGAEIIPYVNDSILRFEPIERGDEGEYYVDIVNNCGYDASTPIQLGVDYLPDLLDSLMATPDTICPDCDLDFIELTAYGDGGGYGDSVVWYQDTVTVQTICGVGQTVHVPLPTQTTKYYAFWYNVCSPIGTGLYSEGTGSSGVLQGVQVYYQENPTVPTSIAASDTIFCVNTYDSIWLFANGGYGDRTEWHIINGSEQEFIGYGGALKVVAPMDTTIYAARMANVCGFSDSLTIQISVVPMPQVFLLSADTICTGYPYEITPATVIAGVYDTLYWTTSSQTGGFDQPDTLYTIYRDDEPLTPFDTTRQFLFLSTQGLEPCGIQVDTLMLLTIPIPNFSVADTGVCRNDTITLMAEDAVKVEWRYLYDDTYISNNNPEDFYPQETDDYYLVGENAQGCIDTVNFEIKVIETPVVDLGDTLSFFSCEPVELTAGFGDGSEYYTWSTGSRANTIYVYETGQYSVIVQSVDNLSCSVSDSVYVSLCDGTMFLPTAFSPNGDGVNEVFKPITSDPTVEFHMMIFNRWGKQIFETYDIQQGWDGTENGEEAPVGGYVYRVNYQGQGVKAPGIKASKTGTFLLVR